MEESLDSTSGQQTSREVCQLLVILEYISDRGSGHVVDAESEARKGEYLDQAGHQSAVEPEETLLRPDSVEGIGYGGVHFPISLRH